MDARVQVSARSGGGAHSRAHKALLQGMAKDYYRYELERTLGLICTPSCNVLPDLADDHVVLCGALDVVNAWNLRTGQLAYKLADPTNSAEALIIAPCAASLGAGASAASRYAVGYADGTVRVWLVAAAGPVLLLTFSGHRGAITALAFDRSGSRLASGSRDAVLILWDVVSESGLYRLAGHSNAITGLVFSASGEVLVSSAKDSLLKVWDLATQHCVETVVVHTGEVTGMLANRACDRLYTIGADRKLRLFSFDQAAVASILNAAAQPPARGGPTDGQPCTSACLTIIDEFDRSSKERATWIAMDDREGHVMVLSNDKSVEVWRILRSSSVPVAPVEEATRQAGEVGTARQEGNKGGKKVKAPQRALKQVRYTRLQSKARSVEFVRGWKRKSAVGGDAAAAATLSVVVAFADNQVSQMVVPLLPTVDITTLRSLSSGGHRTECKVVTASGDSTLFASGSRDTVKVWNVATGSLVRTIDVQEVTVMAFLPGDEALILGDGSGMIHLADLASGDILESCQAHSGPIRALDMRPDRRGLMTGGGGEDKSIKFWELARRAAPKGDASSSSLSPHVAKLKMVKTLQMEDEVVCLKYSPDMRYIAVASLDLTVKVFFCDTLRFYLSLYGHKLPVTAVDISPDGKTLISASMDKNVKIWSLDFGDCRKSIFAHEEGLTAIAFCPGTSMFVTASKDGCIKYWDIEGFAQLQKIKGHHGDIWAMALAGNGQVLLTVSKDRSVRTWRMGDEMIFVEEEREREMEEQFEQSLIQDNPYEQTASSGDNDDLSKESGPATVKTVQSLKAGERIVECIEAADEERRQWDEHEMQVASLVAAHGQEAAAPLVAALDKPTPSSLFRALSSAASGNSLNGARERTPADLVLSTFERIPLPDVEEALLCMPVSILPSLFHYLKEWFAMRSNVVLATRVLDMALTLFHRHVIAMPHLRPQLVAIGGLERQALRDFKDVVGFNSVAMQLI